VYVAGRGATFGEPEGDDDDDDDDDAGQAGKVYTSDPGLSYADALANAAAKLVEDNPDRHFTFENAGVFDGNLSVLTVNHTYDVTANVNAVPQAKIITPQTVLLKPHITGSGVGHTNANNPSDESGYISGMLFIGDGSMAGWNVTPAAADGSSSTISANGAGGTTKTTITPVIDYIVHDGEWFLVANELYGSKLPGVEEESFLVDWTVAQNTVLGPHGFGQLVIGAEVKDASEVDGLSNPGITTLNALLGYEEDDDDVQAIGAAILSLEDEDDVRKAGEQLKPDVTFATQEAARTLNFVTGQYIDQRLAGVGATASPSSAFAAPAYNLGMHGDQDRMSLGVGDGRMNAGGYGGYDGTAANNYDLGRGGMWGQMFGAGLDQEGGKDLDGYNAHIYGGLVGADNWISENVRFGIAGGYGHTGIDGEGFTRQNQTDIDSYLGILYGAIKGQGWYASGRLGYAWNKYETSRVLLLPLAEEGGDEEEDAGPQKLVATASHDASQYMAALEVGAPLRSAYATLTPVASLTWTRLDQEGYQEAGVNRLTIGSQDFDSLQSGLGIKVLAPIASDTLIEGRAIWYHEFDDTNQQVTAAFAEASSFTVAGGDVGRDTAALGVGLLAYIGYGSTFQLNYDALLRDDFIGHTGSGRVRVEF
ncbi:MAG: autotransporter outer membrane beta-barrel domain-containing protein, partial [Phycisphaerae bacterium]|nr:autotransporter outer membrane beta-barrel domain-containing protein [Phycisphaerae bacterium]